MTRPLWIEIDLKALRKNLAIIRRHLGPKVNLLATIKQSAYGHGLIPVARELAKQRVNFYGVGSIEEAIALREDGFSGSVLILSAVMKNFVSYFVKYNITPTVVDIDFARKLNQEAKKACRVVPVHIKIDTGMGRLGPYYKQAFNFIRQLSRLENITLEGIYTHFPVADSDREFTNNQIKIFNNFIVQLKKKKIFFRYYHCANSMGLLSYPKAHFNMVRPGIILYGIKPSDSISSNLHPVLSLKSRVIFLKRIDKGMSVGYGRSYIATKKCYIATIAIGYADGYPWSLSGMGKVIINNKIFNLAGRVCMDHIMVDLGDNKNIAVGEEVILIGRKKGLEILAEDLADLTKTIPYEIVSRLSDRIPRFYKN